MKKIIVAIVFATLLASPILLRPGKKSQSGRNTAIGQQSAFLQYGFYLDEVSKQAGINFNHQSPVLDKKIKHILPQIASVGASVSICDFDNDGWNDIYFTNSRTGTQNALYHNQRDGKFLEVGVDMGVADVNKVGSGVSMGSVWGDYNNDGYEDLFLYKWGKPELFKNDSAKGFTNVTDETGLPGWLNVNTAIWLDFNNDALLDLFVGGYYQEKTDLWNLSTTKFMPESFEYANNGGRNYLLKNQGDGTFKDVTIEYGLISTKWTLAAGATDINGDLYPELVIANDYSVDEFYLNIEGKKFLEIGKDVGMGFAPKSGMNITFGDVENTGELGIYISNITEMGVLLQGNNLWTLEIDESGLSYNNVARSKGVESGGWSYGAQFGDLNNDGNLDIYVANGFISGQKGTSYWYDYTKISGGNNAIISDAMNWPPMDGKSQSGYQQNKIWVNSSDGIYKDVSVDVSMEMALDSRSVAFADLWNRGVLDVVVANQNSVPLVYKNRVDSTNHWIDFDLKGTISNRSAIGAKLELYWDGKKQIQTITGGIGFSSQNQQRIHFGIGKSRQVNQVKIYWPSGVVQILEKPAIDKVHEITEAREII